MNALNWHLWLSVFWMYDLLLCGVVCLLAAIMSCLLLNSLLPLSFLLQRCLDSRYRLLCKQRQDASELKENLQRREKMVSTFLQQQLNHQQLLLYHRFLQTTAYLLIRSKELEEQQRLAQEQLEALGARSWGGAGGRAGGAAGGGEHWGEGERREGEKKNKEQE